MHFWFISNPSQPLLLRSYESFPASSKREQKRRPKPKDGTVLFCGVCGDRALGYNFDAISCESCKAFFRRNALKSKPFACSFDGNCKLDPHTRKFCSGCRIKKCFAVGMKKEWILDAEQLVRRRQRQQSRYQQQQLSSGPDIQPCSSTSGDPLFRERTLSYSPGSVESGCQSSFDNMTLNSSSSSPPTRFYPNAYHRHNSISPPHSYQDPSGLQSSMSIGSSSPLSSSRPELHFSSTYFPPMEPAPSKIPKLLYAGEGKMSPYLPDLQNEEPSSSVNQNDFDDFRLTLQIKHEKEEEERNSPVPLTPYLKDCLENLTKVYNDIFEEAYKPDQIVKNPKSPDQLFNLTEIFIRRLIRFARQIPEFKSLTQHDQIVLLKGGIMEMFFLRSAMSFDAKEASWKFRLQDSAETEGKLNQSAIQLLGSGMYGNHFSLITNLQMITGKDRVTLMLLFIIELLSPDRPNLKDKDVVLQGQERHSSWLRSYLESMQPISKAHALYAELLNKLLDVRNLGEASCQLVMHLDITKLEPLLLEVFDLTPC